MKRREFVRTAAAAGIVGTTATGVASAGAGDTWYVSPENYEDPEHDDEFFVEDPWTGDTVGTGSYGATGDSLVWVHGYNIERDEAQADVFAKRDRVDTYWSTDVDLYGFVWNGHDDFAFGGFSALDFETGENHAWQSSTNLAKFLHVLDDEIAAAGGGKIHLGAHSLGARVVLEALNNLVDDWYDASIETVSIVGGAADDDQIHDKYDRGIDAIDGHAWNYHNRDDQILEWYHWTHNVGGARAIGEVGAWSDSSHPVSSNWTDEDVTGQVPDSGSNSHTSYMEPSEGIPDQVFPPLSEDYSDGGGGGGGCDTQDETLDQQSTDDGSVDPNYVDPIC